MSKVFVLAQNKSNPIWKEKMTMENEVSQQVLADSSELSASSSHARLLAAAQELNRAFRGAFRRQIMTTVSQSLVEILPDKFEDSGLQESGPITETVKIRQIFECRASERERMRANEERRKSLPLKTPRRLE